MAPRSSVCTPGEGWRGRGTSFAEVRAQPCPQSCLSPRPQSCPPRRAPRRAGFASRLSRNRRLGPRGPGRTFLQRPPRWSTWTRRRVARKGEVGPRGPGGPFLRDPSVGLRPGAACGASRWSIFGALVRADQSAVFCDDPLAGPRGPTGSTDSLRAFPPPGCGRRTGGFQPKPDRFPDHPADFHGGLPFREAPRKFGHAHGVAAGPFIRPALDRVASTTNPDT